MNGSEVVEVAAAIASDVLAPHAARVDRDAAWPEAGIRALQGAGLGGLVVPRDAGGHGLGLLALVEVCEVLGRQCASTAISFGMHLVGSAVIAAKATADQRARYLEPIARGEHLTTLAVSEPGTGAHFYIPETRLERREDGFVLTGDKSFVTNGGRADSYVVSAAARDADAAPGEFSCLVVSGGAPGLSWQAPWDGWGMRGNSARSAALRDVAVPRADLLGSEGDEIWYIFHVVAPYFLMAMTGTYLGVAQAALDEAREHLGGRSYAHTGSPLAHQPVLQHRLGALWAQVQRTRSLARDAARMGDEGHPEALPALCSAKAEVAETVDRVTADAMTLLGGRGYAEGSRIHRHYRDARAAHVMAPTTDMLRTWTGRFVLGLPILGD
jgi:alkylation response protein AidB-like acyl-CoA dehydrogenase